MSGGSNFLIKRGSNGVNEANYFEQLDKPFFMCMRKKRTFTILMILISIQLLDEVVNNRKSCGASDK